MTDDDQVACVNVESRALDCEQTEPNQAHTMFMCDSPFFLYFFVLFFSFYFSFSFSLVVVCDFFDIYYYCCFSLAG